MQEDAGRLRRNWLQ